MTTAQIAKYLVSNIISGRENDREKFTAWLREMATVFSRKLVGHRYLNLLNDTNDDPILVLSKTPDVPCMTPHRACMTMDKFQMSQTAHGHNISVPPEFSGVFWGDHDRCFTLDDLPLLTERIAKVVSDTRIRRLKKALIEEAGR